MDADDQFAAAAMELYAARRAEAEQARTRLDATLDALSAPDAEADEGAFYERLRAELTGRLGDAREDVRRPNATLAAFFCMVQLTALGDGRVRVFPMLAEAAVLRILRDVERWPHHAPRMRSNAPRRSWRRQMLVQLGEHPGGIRCQRAHERASIRARSSG